MVKSILILGIADLGQCKMTLKFTCDQWMISDIIQVLKTRKESTMGEVNKQNIALEWQRSG